jgi:hypothetical protein
MVKIIASYLTPYIKESLLRLFIVSCALRRGAVDGGLSLDDYPASKYISNHPKPFQIADGYYIKCERVY